MIYDRFGGDDVDAAARHAVDADADAANLALVLAPLVDAMAALDAAWIARANQRQRIGVHSNQIAKLANVERLSVREGGLVADDTVELLGLALREVSRRLDEQMTAERHDDRLRADVRALLDRLRGVA